MWGGRHTRREIDPKEERGQVQRCKVREATAWLSVAGIWQGQQTRKLGRALICPKCLLELRSKGKAKAIEPPSVEGPIACGGRGELSTHSMLLRRRRKHATASVSVGFVELLRVAFPRHLR